MPKVLFSPKALSCPVPGGGGSGVGLLVVSLVCSLGSPSCDHPSDFGEQMVLKKKRGLVFLKDCNRKLLQKKKNKKKPFQNDLVFTQSEVPGWHLHTICVLIFSPPDTWLSHIEAIKLLYVLRQPVDEYLGFILIQKSGGKTKSLTNIALPFEEHF